VINLANLDWDNYPYDINSCVSDYITWNDLILTVLHKNPSGTYKSNVYINDDECYVGEGAGKNITSGSGIGNTLIGHDAGNDLTTGDYNTLIGMEALADEADVDGCVCVGYRAGKANTQNNITGVGYQALDNNSGTGNTAVGYQAMDAAVSGINNTAVGYNAGGVLTTGHSNTVIGYGAGDNMQTALGNTSVGLDALGGNVHGQNNTAVGSGAGIAIANFSRCVFLGYQAGAAETTNNHLYINNSSSAFPLIYGEFNNDVLSFGDNNAYFFAHIFHENAGGILSLKECTTPTAKPGYGAIYTKGDNKVYFQDGAGAEHEITMS